MYINKYTLRYLIMSITGYSKDYIIKCLKIPKQQLFKEIESVNEKCHTNNFGASLLKLTRMNII